MEKKSLPWLVPYGLKDAWAGGAPPRKGGAKALSVFGSLPPAWPSDPPEQLSTQERHEAWVQVLTLPLPGDIMPGKSHNLSELQFQSRRLKRTRKHEDILSEGWGGASISGNIERNSNPMEKPPDGSVFLGLAHTMPHENDTDVCLLIHSFTADLSTSSRPVFTMNLGSGPGKHRLLAT